ncbi:MAG: hypothetical protein ACRC3I_10450 [Cetobacterium sp.]
MKYDIPILFIVFNRMEITQKSFEKIKKIKPSKLYISSDGPREEIKDENEKVQRVREYILENIDWDCDVATLFQDTNKGCGPNVYQSINWIFKYEEYAIILEDDCVAEKTFFYFVQALLKKYKNDDRVGMISGSNHLSKKIKLDESYLFSNFKNCWGWATWKRAWKNMDYEMTWKNKNYKNVLNNMGNDKFINKYWKYRINLISTNRVSAWDWQWYFSLASQNQLTIYPKINLISNIGFGENATHTKSKPKIEYIETLDIEFPLKHPEIICPNTEFEIIYSKKMKSIPEKIRQKIPWELKRILKFIFRR